MYKHSNMFKQVPLALATIQTDPRVTERHQFHLQYRKQLGISSPVLPFIEPIFALKTFPYLKVMDEDGW